MYRFVIDLKRIFSTTRVCTNILMAGLKNFGDAYLLDTTLWEWSRGPEFLLGSDDAGLRVGHTALLTRGKPTNDSSNDDATANTDSSTTTSSISSREPAAGDGGSEQMKVAFFGGQDGAGVRRQELALLSL